MVGVCCVAPGQTVIRNSWNLCFLSFSCSNGLRGEKSAITGSFININILLCEGGREDLSGLAPFKPGCGAFLSLFLFLMLSFFPSILLCTFSLAFILGIFFFFYRARLPIWFRYILIYNMVMASYDIGSSTAFYISVPNTFFWRWQKWLIMCSFSLRKDAYLPEAASSHSLICSLHLTCNWSQLIRLLIQ